MTTSDSTPTEQAARGTDAADEQIHVLLVDDSQDLVDIVAGLIERDHDDIRVTTATSAVTAFRELTTEEIDCIVSDYRMPAVDGLEFLEEVRDRDADISFILFSNKGSDEIADAAMQAGAFDYVPKGTDSESYGALVQSIRDAVE